ncbi:hypothetical protein K2Y11_22080 [bacterium]|nr:hypothetical protein [bacterium]
MFSRAASINHQTLLSLRDPDKQVVRATRHSFIAPLIRSIVWGNGFPIAAKHAQARSLEQALHQALLSLRDPDKQVVWATG